MNTLDLTKILGNDEIGELFYSPLFGNVTLNYVGEDNIQVSAVRDDGTTTFYDFYGDGRLKMQEKFACAECLLFPSKENRNWSAYLPYLAPNHPVIMLNDKGVWIAGFYTENGTAATELNNPETIQRYSVIIPTEKFDFESINLGNIEFNYGHLESGYSTCYKLQSAPIDEEKFKDVNGIPSIPTNDIIIPTGLLLEENLPTKEDINGYESMMSEN